MRRNPSLKEKDVTFVPNEYNDEITLQVKDLKKQLDEIEAKLGCILSGQALIIGVLNGTIDLIPLQQQDAAKMH